MDSEDYFMAVAALSARRSKDPETGVGACIVKGDNVIAVGHNMMPQDCDELSWQRDGTRNKYKYVCHAGPVAILNARGANLEGCTMYTTLFPSAETAKMVAHVGIKKVIYLSDIYAEREDTIAAKTTLDYTGVEYKKFVGKRDNIEINLEFIESNSMHEWATRNN